MSEVEFEENKSNVLKMFGADSEKNIWNNLKISVVKFDWVELEISKNN